MKPPRALPSPAVAPTPDEPLPVGFRVECRADFGFGIAEIRRYHWSRPLDREMHALGDALVVNMALTTRPARTRVDRLAEGNSNSAEGNSDSAEGRPREPREAGRILVMIPGVRYRLAAPEGSLRSLHCAIDRAIFEELLGGPLDWATLEAGAAEMATASGIEPHLHRVRLELESDRIGRNDAIAASVRLLCVDLARLLRERRPTRADPTGAVALRGGLAAWRLRRIEARLEADAPAPRLAELAVLCGLTERQLGRAFKAETGTSLGRHVDEVTIERAHHLLLTTTEPIAEIARRLGFSGADSFTRAYRRATGRTPAAQRR